MNMKFSIGRGGKMKSKNILADRFNTKTISPIGEISLKGYLLNGSNTSISPKADLMGFNELTNFSGLYLVSGLEIEF